MSRPGTEAVDKTRIAVNNKTDEMAKTPSL